MFSRFFSDPFFRSSFHADPNSSLFDSDPFFHVDRPKVTDAEQEKKYDPVNQQTDVKANEKTVPEADAGKRTPASPRRVDRTKHEQPADQQISTRPTGRGLAPWSASSMLDDFFDDRMFGFGSMGSMLRRMDRLDRMMHERMAEEEQGGGSASPSSASYSYSSSSFSHTGADGQPVESRTTRHSRRRVGDVLEESTEVEDSHGNRRTTSKRGLTSSNQMHEVITDRNGKGEERKVENLRGIKPEEVAAFDQQWQQAREKIEADRWNGAGSLTDGAKPQARLASADSEKKATSTDVKSKEVQPTEHPTSPKRTRQSTAAA